MKKPIKIALLSIIILLSVLYIFQNLNPNTKDSRILEGQIENYVEENKDNNKILNNTIKRKIPESFRIPAKGPDKPIIKDAKIEKIEIPDHSGLYADIVISIDGVSDERIIEINDILTGSIFIQNDIRKKENRVLEKIEIDGFDSRIIYLDKNFLEYNMGYQVYFEGAAHPTHVYNVPDTIILNPTKEAFIFSENTDEILKLFYPNMEELIKDVPSDSILFSCFVPEDGSVFSIEDFYPTLRVSTQEVIYLKWFPYINNFCTPELQIAIPISDILKEVPQYVPKDSVLWEFK